LVYEAWRCTEEERNLAPLDPTCVEDCEPTDPPCASSDEIDTWLSNKKLWFWFINTKIDFKKYDNETER